MLCDKCSCTIAISRYIYGIGIICMVMSEVKKISDELSAIA